MPGLEREQWLKLSYDALREKNLNLFRKLNAVIFPVSYADKFYSDCMAAGKVTQLGTPLPTAPPPHSAEPPPPLARWALRAARLTRAGWPAYSLPTDVLVGGIACRYEKVGSRVRMYIMTLGVLAPYRGRGVGQRLLVRALTEGAKEPGVEDVYLHVQARPLLS
jgi:ribosomal protein S18 acetylase RimI-like enzyme